MRSHSHGGVVCEHGTKKACLAARRLAMGKCTAQIEDRNEPRSCDNWATDTLAEKGYCGQHYASAANKAIARRNRQIAIDRTSKEIHHYMAWSGQFPSIWDRFPADWRERLPN